MRYTLILILLSALLLVGCASVSGPPVAIETSAPTSYPATPVKPTERTTATIVPTILEITTSTPQSTLTPTLVVEGVSIPIEEKCPAQRVVPLEMLEIETEYRLLVLPSEEVINTSNNIPPLIISPHDSQSAITTKLDTTRSHYDEAVSPDKKWVILYRPSEAENQDVVWVSSIEGEERFPVVQIDNKNLAKWANEQELLILGRPNAEEFPKLEFWDYFPFLHINLSTREETQLKYLSHEEKGKREYIGYVTHQDHAYTLYSELTDGGINYYLYDYNTGENLPMFQWLSSIDLLESLINLPIQPVQIYDEEKFGVFINRPYGVDVAMNINIDTAVQEKNYDAIMKKYSIPDQFTPISFLGFVPDKDMVLYQSLDPFNEKPNWLLLFNYHQEVIIDYCYELKNVSQPARFSPNGRFAAINFFRINREDDQSYFYAVIFDLINGKVAYLDGYYVIDWVISPETH